MDTKNKMTNLQLELLKAFSFDVDDGQLLEIKDLLAQYFADKAREEMDRIWEQKGWSEETIKKWYDEHMRTKYTS